MQKQLVLILLIAFVLRLYGINWDGGLHLHPDERQLLLVANQINFFKNLNPNFFNYGSLPLYLLKGLAQLLDLILPTNLATYDGMLLLGRFLSTLADLGTIYLIYKIALLLFKNKKTAFLSSFFYAIAFFPIQNSHFFIVDTFLTFFTTLLVFALIQYFKKPVFKKVILIAFAAVCAVTTKISALIFLPLVAGVLIIKTKSLKDFFLFSFFSLLFSFLFMPYAYLNWQRFSHDVFLQLKLNSDPYVFPYTLQYVGTIPYLYYLKNIFLWGLGPIISVLSVFGLFFVIKDKLVNKNGDYPYSLFLISFSFYAFYFLIIGRSAVKFMRYMLPLYPFFALLAAYGFSTFMVPTESKKFGIERFLCMLILVFALCWTLMFVNIYSKKHTRIAATEWIHKNIPEGSTLAVEHWDDRLPIFESERYNFVELTLYEQPDDKQKWTLINENLHQADYLIIASNRLYVPLQRLSNCQKYERCYPTTSNYYQELFSGRLGFQKVAEFAVYPGFQVSSFRFQVSDQTADESFTVYDHPKIMIFRKK